jgi:hypothetical protein
MHHHQSRAGLLLGFLLFSCLGSIDSAFAQSTFGSILGTVKDASGSVVPNATVKLINVDENASRTLTTNDNGDYEAASKSPPPVFKLSPPRKSCWPRAKPFA